MNDILKFAQVSCEEVYDEAPTIDPTPVTTFEAILMKLDELAGHVADDARGIISLNK